MRLEAEMSLANGHSVRQTAEFAANTNPLLTLELEGFAVFIASPTSEVQKLHVVIMQGGATALNETVEVTVGREVDLHLRVQGVRVRLHPTCS